jgi:aspartate/methionine/tyrosine aminotransferase
VAITPGRDFGVHAPARHLRFSYATERSRLAEGVARIAAFLGC